MEACAAANTRRGLLAPLTLAGLMLLLYTSTLAELIHTWWTSPEHSHGLLVPLISGFLVWRGWGRLKEIARSRSPLGLWVIGAGLVILLFAKWAEVNFLAPFSLWVVGGGLILHFGGKQVLRGAFFPYLFLAFAIPVPDLVIEYLSFPLQLLSTRYSTMVLGMLGLQATANGVNILTPDFQFTVGAPCSGLKSFMALMTMAALVAYLARAGTARRIALFALGAPMALAANVGRIVAILLIAHFWGGQAAQGFFHGLSGIALFLAALLGLLALGRLMGIRRFTLEEAP